MNLVESERLHRQTQIKKEHRLNAIEQMYTDSWGWKVVCNKLTCSPTHCG